MQVCPLALLSAGLISCRLLLPSLLASSSAGAYADVNKDDIIDEIIATINEPTQRQRCIGIAMAGVPPIEQLWNGSICMSGIIYF